MSKLLMALAVSAACLGLTTSPAIAGGTIVSPIYGTYDAQCGVNIDCTFGTNLPVVYSSGGNGYGQEYDTPALFIVNNTPYDFTNVTIGVTGYQDQANGYTASAALPTIAAGTIYDLQWGYVPNVTGNDPVLFSYDYDDQFGGGFENISGCVQPYSYCTYVGNFNVVLNATENGKAISALFSPDNTQPYSNAAGKFVGFEGLNPAGLSETVYDDHFGSQPGVLAYIYTGVNGTQSSAPEPATWAMMLLGFGLSGMALRTRRSRHSRSMPIAMN